MYYILVFVIGLFIGSKLSNVNIGWNNTIENDLTDCVEEEFQKVKD